MSSSDNASESGGSSEDFDSPRSVIVDREPPTKGAWLVHSQVLRIKEEDLHVGEDDVNKVAEKRTRHDSIGPGGRVLALSTERLVRPCSPLGGRVIVNHSR
ncbi:hypothetical protein MLD38_001323 [Melastoma candidum]|uniref:Uncharacterized protein n=1 Tax=Melastoma candidum TaxID=119954 RepID=A0ACB9SGU1_9MYRT|nr:hypothetical protein MLD38_001323 [Melastoma candidum]